MDTNYQRGDKVTYRSVANGSLIGVVVRPPMFGKTVMTIRLTANRGAYRRGEQLHVSVNFCEPR